MDKITKDQIKHVAKLSKLNLSETELQKFENEFNSILDYTSQLDEVDTSDINISHNMSDYSGEFLNEYLVSNSEISREEMLKNATDGRFKNGYIRTSKIIDKE